HLFSQYDNELRKNKCVTGMKEKLMQGYWPFIPPTGYDNLNQGKTADQHKLVINKQGKLLKKAFDWKAKKDWSLVTISEKLESQGLSIPPKRLTDYFRNPFYCGFVVSKMIPGEMIEGKHPPLVPKSTFLQVHKNLSKFNSGYTIEKEVDALPLKQFVKCDCCGTSMTGYIVKKKNLYYYKCNQKGCKKNRSQKILHQKFEDLLSQYMVNPKVTSTVSDMMKYVIWRNISHNQTDTKSLRMNLSKIKKKLNKIEERFVLGEIEQDLYLKYRDKTRVEIEQIEQKLDSDQITLSNLEKAVTKAVNLASSLPSIWRKESFEGKRNLQYLVFPEGIRYNRKNDNYRTPRINLLFSVIPYLLGAVEDYKKGDSINFDQIPAWVGPLGLEPRTC
ncbi:MAG: recombinase family protein, partial [Flavobacteriales bacterium]|nr:recombinase family protein [Flavobacteriales bacterium]